MVPDGLMNASSQEPIRKYLTFIHDHPDCSFQWVNIIPVEKIDLPNGNKERSYSNQGNNSNGGTYLQLFEIIGQNIRGESSHLESLRPLNTVSTST